MSELSNDLRNVVVLSFSDTVGHTLGNKLSYIIGGAILGSVGDELDKSIRKLVDDRGEHSK